MNFVIYILFLVVYSSFLGNIFYRHSIDRTLIDQSNQVVNLVLNDERLQNIIFPDFESNSTRPVRPPRPSRPTRPIQNIIHSENVDQNQV